MHHADLLNINNELEIRKNQLMEGLINCGDVDRAREFYNQKLNGIEHMKKQIRLLIIAMKRRNVMELDFESIAPNYEGS